MSDGNAGAGLTDDEVARYHRDGVLVPDYRVPGALLARMRDALERLTERNRHMSSDIMICPHLQTGSTQGLEGGREWLEFAAIPDLLNMTAQLIGPDIILWGTTVFGKPAGSGKETPWHQDAQYWPIRPLATCSVWIALDHSTPENGCLRVIPAATGKSGSSRTIPCRVTTEPCTRNWRPANSTRPPPRT